MGKKKKTVLRGFSYHNCDDFAAYLNHMARQGWHFKEWRAGLVFEKGQPEDAVYAVEIFTKAEDTDLRPLPQTEEFAEYCEAAGWEFVDAWQKFLVFRQIREDAVPIMTDAERLENVIKAEKNFFWWPLIHSAIWLAMKLSEYGFLFSSRIFSPYYLITLSFWGMVFLLTALRFCHFLLWKRRCRQRLDRGFSLFFGRDQVDKRYTDLHILVLFLFCVSMFLIGERMMCLLWLAYTLGILLLAFILGKLRPDSTTSGLIQILGTIAIFLGIFLGALYTLETRKQQETLPPDPPLTYEDMGIELDMREIRYSREEENIFGRNQYANLDYGNDYLYYRIYTTDIPWVLDKLWKDETDGKVNDTRQDCTASWGAAEAFRNNAGNYIVRYEDALWVICLSLEEPLTQEQIDLTIAAIRGG